MAVVLVALAVAASGVGAGARGVGHVDDLDVDDRAKQQTKDVKPPAEWDEQLAPIAHEVESIRG